MPAKVRHRCNRCRRISFTATAKPLINATVNAPVVQNQATGVTGAEENFPCPKTCSLSDDNVYRPVLCHGVTGVSGATNMFCLIPDATVRLDRWWGTGATGRLRMHRCWVTSVTGATVLLCFQLSWFGIVSNFELLFFQVFSRVLLSCLRLNWASVHRF